MPTRVPPVACDTILEIDHRPKGTAFGTRWAASLAAPRRLGGLDSSGGGGVEGAGGNTVPPSTLSACRLEQH